MQLRRLEGEFEEQSEQLRERQDSVRLKTGQIGKLSEERRTLQRMLNNAVSQQEALAARLSQARQVSKE